MSFFVNKIGFLCEKNCHLMVVDVEQERLVHLELSPKKKFFYQDRIRSYQSLKVVLCFLIF
jgi:hypothetical protein